jgi:C-terminal processing protease CtpA/Prc
VAGPYLEELFQKLERSSINRDTIDWPALRTEVLARAGSAQTVRDALPAVQLALELLDDHESYYTARDGQLIGPSPVGGCSGAARTPPDLPDNIGYIRVSTCPCDGAAATQFAESIQRAISQADRDALIGWIVDLRGNIGGNMWPMIAGVGPILGEGIIGWIVYYNREYEREYRGGAALSLGEPFASVGVPYALRKPFPRVAVLTDGGVASAGEAVTVFFKGRPDTRSFGTATCGHHHLQEDIRMSDGAILSLQTSQHADRNKRRYGGAIQPDETIGDPDAVGRRAIAWLQGGR